MTRFACALVVLLAACEREDPPPAPIPDGSVGLDAPFDATVVWRSDSGPDGPVVDGELGEDEWEGAPAALADVETDREGSTLTRLAAQLIGGRLVIGVEGTVAGGDSIVIYVDRALGETDGVAPGTLDDDDGALDVILSGPALTAPTGFEADFAWGTTRMPFAAVGLDDAIGWRDVSDPQDLEIIDAELAPSACTARACEASIPLEALGGARPRTIALFARIVRADGGLTNQTLPEDDPDAPGTVSTLLTVDDGLAPDGGMPDGGVGPVPVVVDGVIGADEWAAAMRFRNDVAPGIAGNSLSTLYARRDETHLHVAIEGRLTDGNAILMYVDRDYGGADGVVPPNQIDDVVGALDRALSKLLSPEAQFRMDMAWGTTRMNLAEPDERMGWRDVATDPSAFRAVSAPSVCSADACETSIPLAALGAGATEDVALFVRLGSAIGDALSNQTLPVDFEPTQPMAFAILPAP